MNIQDIFAETHDEIFGKYKNIGYPKKYDTTVICHELLKFVSNSVYWTRHNMDPLTKKYDDSCISGKYLNEIHLSYVNSGFYTHMYKKVLKPYFEMTKYETLKNISADSVFVRNIGGICCQRNPYYNNKPGIKLHTLVDSLRTPLSFVVSSCNDNDSLFIEELFNNILVDDNLLNEHIDTFLADSAYSSIYNIFYLTNRGLNTTMGRSKSHLSQTITVTMEYDNQSINYKSRVSVENYFGHIERYPCLINNYEKCDKSYIGLVLFVSTVMLINKINKIAKECTDANIKEKREAEVIRKRDVNKKKIMKNKIIKEKMKEKQNAENNRRKKETLNILNNVKDTIWNNIDKKTVQYNYNKNIGNRNRQLIKYSKGKHSNYIKNKICDSIKNNILTKTFKYTFGKKYKYIVTTKAYAFSPDVIKDVVGKLNIKKEIKSLSIDFFG